MTKAKGTLGHAVLADHFWYEQYKVLAVALSRVGLAVLVEKGVTGLSDRLGELAKAELRFREIGPIENAARGGDSTGAGAGTQSSGSFGCLVEDAKKTRYGLSLNVPYANGRARFVDQIGIDGGGVVFADKGDSGAVVLDASNRVVGLLFSAAPQSCLGFANPISDVETELGVTVA